MENNKKKIIVLKHDGGELANQLWSYVSIFSYALEKGFRIENWSFFEYSHYFKNLEPRNIFVKTLFFLPMQGHEGRRSRVRARIFRFLYKIFAVIFEWFVRGRIVFSNETTNAVFYLPPTEKSKEKLENLERGPNPIYFCYVSGGVFRNPKGIEKFREEVKRNFTPSEAIWNEVKEIIDPLKKRYKSIVGVHIRQSDYRTFKSGKYFVDQKRAREILEEFLLENGKKKEETCFIVTSDGAIDRQVFEGLNTETSKRSAGVDLFLLSACDIVLGSDSTFGNLSAYLGDVPHVVFKNEKMDWAYYKNREKYFLNRYLTIMAQ